jgi:hypothetical protein
MKNVEVEEGKMDTRSKILRIIMMKITKQK